MENLNPGLWALSQRSLVMPVVTDGSQVASRLPFSEPIPERRPSWRHWGTGGNCKRAALCFFSLHVCELEEKGKEEGKNLTWHERC